MAIFYKNVNPTSSDNISTGYSVDDEWRNIITYSNYIHTSSGVWTWTSNGGQYINGIQQTFNLDESAELLELRVETLEERQTIVFDYKGTVEPISPIDEFIWFDENLNETFIWLNEIWLEIPMSTKSVYVDAPSGLRYAWSGSALIPTTVHLTKNDIENLIYVNPITLESFNIDLSIGEVFTKSLTVPTTFTITNPITYKGFKLKLIGGTLNIDLFTDYTENWILNSLITDYDNTVENWLCCEIREDDNIYLYWGE